MVSQRGHGETAHVADGTGRLAVADTGRGFYIVGGAMLAKWNPRERIRRGARCPSSRSTPRIRWERRFSRWSGRWSSRRRCPRSSVALFFSLPSGVLAAWPSTGAADARRSNLCSASWSHPTSGDAAPGALLRAALPLAPQAIRCSASRLRQESIFDGLRQLDSGQARLRIQIILPGFIDHSDQSLSCSVFVGKKSIRLSLFQIVASATIGTNGEVMVSSCSRHGSRISRVHPTFTSRSIFRTRPGAYASGLRAARDAPNPRFA